ncbi:Aspartyl aminopeptidase [Lamellibrachia satsuma]|nr:Aspartyl aminopeptidase [Lamellibrachia satsuma]
MYNNRSTYGYKRDAPKILARYAILNVCSPVEERQVNGVAVTGGPMPPGISCTDIATAERQYWYGSRFRTSIAWKNNVNLAKQLACSSMETFADMCGILVRRGSWRKQTGCLCPGDLVWTTCGRKCVRTCTKPKINCSFKCVAKCQCPRSKLYQQGNSCLSENQRPKRPPTCLLQSQRRIVRILTEMGPTTVPSADTVKTAAKEFLKFINRSPSPFHVVEECKARLVAAGFSEIKESEPWDVKPKDKCFVTRNQSAIVAFAVGAKYRPGNGFNIIGAHTDSPVLKVKPISAREKHGYVQVGVECYGGGMWHSWLDRDLKLAGRVFIRTGDTIESRLLNVNRPIMRVPNICIHFQREMSTKFEFNKETHLLPVIATTVKQKLESKESTVHNEATSSQPAQDQCDKHSPAVIQLLCDELAVEPTQILDFELFLSDAVPATLGGVYEEFVFAPRLDNQHSCFCAIQGLTEACSEAGSLDDEPHIRMIALFDNEEVGSETAVGAGSTLLELILRRLSSNGSHTAFEESMPKSLMVSADMAHAIHPNYR